MERALAEFIWQRAGHSCEYCLMPSQYAEASFQIDHIIAVKHGGETKADNLALSCYSCNTYKGPNIASIDSVTGKLVRLFNPRRDRWSTHFSWDGAVVVGRTAVGRTTIQALWMNHPLVVETRMWLMSQGLFPPS